MRLHRIFTFALAMIPVIGQSADYPLEIIERFDGTKVVVNIDERDIAAAPAWRPAEGEPPVSIAALVTAVEEWTATHPDFAKESIRKIELKPISRHEGQRHWYYLVQMRDPADARASPHYLAVMMDGKIHPAIKEPSSYK